MRGRHAGVCAVRPRRLAALIAVLALSGAAAVACDNATGAAQASPPEGLRAAVVAMRTVNGFRFTADVVSGTQKVHVTGVFSAPDSLDETVVAGSQTLELLKVGSRTFRRDKPNGAWLAVPATSATSTTDPRSAFNTLAGATSVTVEGSTYQFSLSNAAAAQLIQGSASVTGSALVAGGRITDLRYQSSSPSITVHLTYSAFNQTPAVTLPPGA